MDKHNFQKVINWKFELDSTELWVIYICLNNIYIYLSYLIACCTLSQQLFIIWRSISTETLITIINRSISIDMLYLHGGQCRYSVRMISIKKNMTRSWTTFTTYAQNRKIIGITIDMLYLRCGQYRYSARRISIIQLNYCCRCYQKDR